MKTIIAINIETPRQFISTDDRNGLYYGDIRLERVTPDGSHLEWLTSPDVSTSIASSGLRKTADESYYGNLEMARAIRRALLTIGREAYIKPEDPDAWTGSYEFLAAYLRQTEYANERKAQARELRVQARQLIEQARRMV